MSLAKCRRCTCVNTKTWKSTCGGTCTRFTSSADFRQVQAPWYAAEANTRSRSNDRQVPKKWNNIAGRFRESAQAPTRFFQTSRDRDTVDAAQNVVRSLLGEIDDEVTRKKTGRSRSETPWFKRRHSRSETTAAPIPPPQTALRLMHPPLLLTVVTTSDANEEAADFRQQMVASVPRGEPGGWRHGFQLTSLSTSALTGFFDVADRKGRAQFSQVTLALVQFRPAGHSDHFPTRVECVEQDRSGAGRSNRALGTPIRAVHGWTMSRCLRIALCGAWFWCIRTHVLWNVILPLHILR